MLLLETFLGIAFDLEEFDEFVLGELVLKEPVFFSLSLRVFPWRFVPNNWF